MDYQKIFDELVDGAKVYKGYRMEYWDGVEDCACAIIDSLVSSTIMTTRDAKEAKAYMMSLRNKLFDEEDF